MTAPVFDTLPDGTVNSTHDSGVFRMPPMLLRGSDASARGALVSSMAMAGGSAQLGPAALGSGALRTGFVLRGSDTGANGQLSIGMRLVGHDRTIVVDYSVGVLSTAMSLQGTTTSATYVDATLQLPLMSLRGSDAAASAALKIGMRMRGSDRPRSVVGVLSMTTGYMLAYTGYPSVEVVDTAFAAGLVSFSRSFGARDASTARDVLSTTLHGRAAVAEAANAGDATTIAYLLVAEAQALAVDDAAGYLTLLLEAADVALADGAVATQLDAFAAVAALAEAHDVVTATEMLDATSAGALFDEAAVRRIGLLVEALVAATATDEAVSSARFVVSGTDAAVVSEDTATALSALVDAFDAGLAFATVRIGGETYAAYAMTLAGQAISEYRGVAANSFATIDGRLYAATSSGLVLMEGDTDDGAPINASLRVGLSALGTQLKKAIPAAYIGYTSDGVLLLKVSTTDRGVKKTNIYKLNPVRKDVVSDNRFTPSKGLHSVYWDFELANHDGADFELETIKVWRMPLTRRK